MKAFKPDCIIALGGGSAMDAGKIMWVMYEHPEVDFMDMAMRFMDIRKRVYTFPKMGEKAYFIAIPTSAGTAQLKTSIDTAKTGADSLAAGAKQEKIDPVRFITNHSTGKMGRAIAENCMLRGAHVTLVNASVSVAPPMFVDVVNVTSAADMADVVKSKAAEQDIIIMTAAVADFCPSHPADEKIKKNDSSYESVIELERTEDILSYLGAHKAKGQLICGFSMETQNMLENSKAKLAKKNADMIVANNLKVAGAGFGTDTNVVTLITADDCTELEIMDKSCVAARIMDRLLKM